MTAPQQDAPRPKMPSFRTLLARAVGALESIADLLEEQNALYRDGLEAAVDAVPRCDAPFTIGGLTDESVRCTRELGDDGKHLRTPGLNDDVHAHGTSGTVWRTP